MYLFLMAGQAMSILCGHAFTADPTILLDFLSSKRIGKATPCPYGWSFMVIISTDRVHFFPAQDVGTAGLYPGEVLTAQ